MFRIPTEIVHSDNISAVGVENFKQSLTLKRCSYETSRGRGALDFLQMTHARHMTDLDGASRELLCFDSRDLIQRMRMPTCVPRCPFKPHASTSVFDG